MSFAHPALARVYRAKTVSGDDPQPFGTEHLLNLVGSWQLPPNWEQIERNMTLYTQGEENSAQFNFLQFSIANLVETITSILSFTPNIAINSSGPVLDSMVAVEGNLRFPIPYDSFDVFYDSTLGNTAGIRSAFNLKADMDQINELKQKIPISPNVESYLLSNVGWIKKISIIQEIIANITRFPQKINMVNFREENHRMIVYAIEVDDQEKRRSVRSKIINKLKEELPEIKFVDFIIQVNVRSNE